MRLSNPAGFTGLLTSLSHQPVHLFVHVLPHLVHLSRTCRGGCYSVAANYTFSHRRCPCSPTAKAGRPRELTGCTMSQRWVLQPRWNQRTSRNFAGGCSALIADSDSTETGFVAERIGLDGSIGARNAIISCPTRRLRCCARYGFQSCSWRLQDRP